MPKLKIIPRLACVLLIASSCLVTQQASGQFTTVMNIPPDPDIRNNGFRLGSNTQLNIWDGGFVGGYLDAGTSHLDNTNIEVNVHEGATLWRFMDAYSGSTVNVSGGTVGKGLRTYEGSTINVSGGIIGEDARFEGIVHISGGTIEGSLSLQQGAVANITGGVIKSEGFESRYERGPYVHSSELNISGGSFGESPDAQSTSTINISGNDFQFNGVPIAGLDNVGVSIPFELPRGGVLSGTLADGTPFGFASKNYRWTNYNGMHDASINLIATELPVVEAPATFSLPEQEAPFALRSGQTALVNSGGTLRDNYNAGAGSVVVVNHGGRIDNHFNSVGAQVDVAGGTLGDYFDAFAGSEINIQSGTVGYNFDAYIGSTLNVSGGTFWYGPYGRSFTTLPGSQLNLSGAEFYLNGVQLDGLDAVGNSLQVDLPTDSVLSGTLADGTPFAFSSQQGDSLADGTVTLKRAVVPTIGPAEVMVPQQPSPTAIRSGQLLIVNDEGIVGADFRAAQGASVRVHAGGEIGDRFEAAGISLDIDGGSIGDYFVAYNSNINQSGGRLGNTQINSGTTLDMTGGSVARLTVSTGSQVNIRGGTVSERFSTASDTLINISDGYIRDTLAIGSGSVLNLEGGNLREELWVGGELNMSGGVVDRIDTSQNSVINISGGTVLGNLETTPNSMINVSGGSVQRDLWLQSFSELNLSGGRIGRLVLYDNSSVNIYGNDFRIDGMLVPGLAPIGDSLYVQVPHGSVLSGTLADGTPFLISTLVGDGYHPQGGLTINSVSMPGSFPPVITLPADQEPLGVREGQTIVVGRDGVLSDNFQAGWGSTLELHDGGRIGNGLEAIGARISISGGTIGSDTKLFEGTVASISGGTIDNRFDVYDGSEVHFFGSEFRLNGVNLADTLTPNTPFTITDRNVWLQGTLEDGTDFSYFLASNDTVNNDYFDLNALLTITLVADILPGDFNNDGTVDLADYTVWRNNLGADITLPGDTTPGTVTAADYDIWKQNFGQTSGLNANGDSQNVPEPAGVGLLVAAMLLAMGFGLSRKL